MLDFFHLFTATSWFDAEVIFSTYIDYKFFRKVCRHQLNFESRLLDGFFCDAGLEQPEHRRYRWFAAFRIRETLSLTDPAQWRWVPTLHNVAVEATKWDKSPRIDIKTSTPEDSRALIYSIKSEWLKRSTDTPLYTEKELHPLFVHRNLRVEKHIDYGRF